MMQGSYQFEALEHRHIEAAHLKERSQLRLDGFCNLLRRNGLRDGMDILDVGCGQGVRTNLMGSFVPQSRITGFDRSPELLAEARLSTQVANCHFQQGDLYQLPFSEASFDFVYSRLVFMHLSNPIAAMRELKRVLRPGGVLLIEDGDRDCMFFEPRPASFDQFWSLVQNGQRRLGGDPNVGRKLASYMMSIGLQDVTTEVQPIVGNGSDIEFLARTLMPSLNLYLEPSDRVMGTGAIHDLMVLSQQPEACFYHIWFVAKGIMSK